ncbi:hypothetical protein ACFL27_18995 [candidate division CSSED10-310 bacterium]|uniref:4Fe-4S ferredoxin-type domain-containing protein n=1 Tax=candidate division CSSED10-310 bacterium TaxID=2855610 RepID=A0ABV6Z1G4_UNCC1
MEQRLKQLAYNSGAAAVGIANAERLIDKPSMDPNYLLPWARSVISVMLPFDDEIVRMYLAKKDRPAMQIHETEIYRGLEEISRKLADELLFNGFRAVAAESNLDYRFKQKFGWKIVPYPVRQALLDWLSSPCGPLERRFRKSIVELLFEYAMRAPSWRLTPTISHRYAAVAAGLGTIGWSGNVLHPKYGARVLFNTVITDAPLTPDPMDQEIICDGCRRCVISCQGRFIDAKREDSVFIGGQRFVHALRSNNLRCILVCAGFTGQSADEMWSTWSPGRFKLPASDEMLDDLWEWMVKTYLCDDNHYARTLANLTFHTEYGHVRKPQDRFEITCGNCQFVCARNRQTRLQLSKLLRKSGAVQRH